MYRAQLPTRVAHAWWEGLNAAHPIKAVPGALLPRASLVEVATFVTPVSLLCSTRQLGEAALLPPHAVLQATSSVLQAASIRDLAGWQERGWEGKQRLPHSGGGGGLKAASCGALAVQSDPMSAPRPPATTCSSSSPSAPSSITAAVVAREEEAPIWSCRGSWQLGVAAAGLAVGCAKRLKPDTEADSVQAIHIVYCKVHLNGIGTRTGRAASVGTGYSATKQWNQGQTAVAAVTFAYIVWAAF